MNSQLKTARPPLPLTETPLVDAHAHVYTLDMPMLDSAWHKPLADATIANYLATLDRNGVHFGVLSAASMYGDYNDYMLEALRVSKRLRATVIVEPDIDLFALRELDMAGVVGVRLQFRNVASPPDISSYSYQRLFRRIADLGWHLHLHDEGERLPNYLKHIVNAGPPLVIDHMGRPPAPAGLAMEGFKQVLQAVERGNTWVKLSGGFRLGEPAFVETVAQTFLTHAGTERLLWGSDWPFAAYEDTLTYEDAIGLYRRFVPDAEVRRAIDQTALRFYFS